MYIDVTYNKQFALILNIVDIWMFFFTHEFYFYFYTTSTTSDF